MYIGVTSDQHVGSAFGLWAPEVKLSSGGHYQLHKGQRYLLQHWQRIAAELPPLDVLIWNGDAIDGRQPKSHGRYIIEPEPVKQVEVLLELARPFLARVRDGGQVFVLRGTQYHDEDDAAMETFAREIGAQRDDYGHYSWDWLLIEWRHIVFDIAHSQSLATRYRAMPLEREGQFSDMAGLQADVVVRGHIHNPHWHYIEGGNRLPMRLEVSAPPWQLQPAYAQRSRMPNRLLTRNLGMLVLEVEEDWVSVRPYLFAHPPQRRVRVGA